MPGCWLTLHPFCHLEARSGYLKVCCVVFVLLVGIVWPEVALTNWGTAICLADLVALFEQIIHISRWTRLPMIFARLGGFRKKTVLPKGNTLIFQICTIQNYYSLKNIEGPTAKCHVCKHRERKLIRSAKTLPILLLTSWLVIEYCQKFNIVKYFFDSLVEWKNYKKVLKDAIL